MTSESLEVLLYFLLVANLLAVLFLIFVELRRGILREREYSDHLRRIEETRDTVCKYLDRVSGHSVSQCACKAPKEYQEGKDCNGC